MKKKNETQEKMRTELEKKGWKFYKKSTHAVCPNQLRLTVNDAYMYAYPYMQGIWCNLCVAFGLKENYNLNRRTVDNYIPDGKQSWRLLAVDTINGVRFYEHKLSSRRIDYSKQEK